ncbi:hypothetical protein BGX27_006943 [Mortierella sp. AM989]|nr:hypothetical protein BGX27_006943 [Mortierella sp. AM989]
MPIQAQFPSPLPSQEFAFARAGSKFYIQGGKFVQNDVAVSTTNQLFSLDLSISWSVNSPPWQSLAPGVNNYNIHGAATSDNKTLLVFMHGNNGLVTIPRYDILTDTWSPNPLQFTPDQDTRVGSRPVLDPVSGLIYLNAFQNLDIYNPLTTIMKPQQMPSSIPTSKRFGGVAYISSRRSLMYIGGLNGTVQLDDSSSQVREYSLSSGAWSFFSTTGEPPIPRADNCVAASEDGNTLIVYGGRIAVPNFTSTLYILDVPTGKWTKGPDGTVRSYMGCIIVGDQFLAWGGYDGKSTITGPPEVFSLTTRQWVNTYTAPSYYTNLSPSSSGSGTTATSSTSPLPSNPSSNPSSNNLAAIFGGVAGCLLIILLSGATYLYLKRKEKRGKYGDVQTREKSPESLARLQASNRDPQALSAQDQRPSVPIFSFPTDSELMNTVHRNDSRFNQTNSSAIYNYTSPYFTSNAGVEAIHAHDPYAAIRYGNGYEGYAGPSGVMQDVNRNMHSDNSKTQYDYPVSTYVSPPLTVSQNYHMIPGTTLTPAVIDSATGQVYVVSAPPGNIMSMPSSSTNIMAISTPPAINTAATTPSLSTSTTSNASSPNIQKPVSYGDTSSVLPQSSQSPPTIPQRPGQNSNANYSKAV